MKNYYLPNQGTFWGPTVSGMKCFYSMQHIHAQLTTAYLHGVVKFVEACTDNSLAAVLNMVTLQVYVVEGRKPSN